MQIEQLPVKDLVPYANNAKEHPPAQIKQIVASIQEFGFNDPIAIDENNVIIEGHGRLLAAKKLKLKEVPVIRLSHLSEAQKRAYIIAHNKLTLNSGFDVEKLKLEFEALQELDFDLTHTGFELTEVGDYLKGLEEKKTNPAGDPDDIPEPPKAPVTRPGDLYEIGPHRLLCGDSTVSEIYETLMAGRKADIVFTDPPYNVDYEGKTKDALKIENDKMDGEQFFQFLLTVHQNLANHSNAGAAIYVCHADSEGENFRKAMRMGGWLLKQTCTWVKNVMVMGRQDYHWQHEPILYGWKPGASHNWYADRKQTTVWHFDRPQKNIEHPTMKPVDLIMYALGNSSKRGDLVLDAFGGSGSTMVAAHQLDRKCNLIELDPRYCDVIVARMRKLWPDLPILRNGEAV